MCIKNDECKFDRRAPLGVLVLVLALALGVVEVYVYALLPPLPLEGEERERGEGGEVKTGQGVDKSWVEVDPNPDPNPNPLLVDPLPNLCLAFLSLSLLLLSSSDFAFFRSSELTGRLLMKSTCPFSFSSILLSNFFTLIFLSRSLHFPLLLFLLTKWGWEELSPSLSFAFMTTVASDEATVSV